MFIVIEIQTNSNGTIGVLTNSYDNQMDAEHKYHEVLSAAAISQLPVHAAVIMTNEGYVDKSERYVH